MLLHAWRSSLNTCKLTKLITMNNFFKNTVYKKKKIYSNILGKKIWWWRYGYCKFSEVEEESWKGWEGPSTRVLCLSITAFKVPSHACAARVLNLFLKFSFCLLFILNFQNDDQMSTVWMWSKWTVKICKGQQLN